MNRMRPNERSILKLIPHLLGTREGLVGGPEKAKGLAKNVSDVQVEILDTGHLISAEKPDQFNKLVIDFIGHPAH